MVGGWGIIKAVAKTVIFATLCSNPVVIKANRHQKIMMSLAVSSLSLREQITARQTRMLQSTPRKKAEAGERAILACAVVVIKPEISGIPS